MYEREYSMNKNTRVIALLGLLLLGCVSPERKADYAAWQNSDDAVAQVSLEEFEAKYKADWPARAEKKRQARLEREAAERARLERERAAAEKARLEREAAERARLERERAAA